MREYSKRYHADYRQPLLLFRVASAALRSTETGETYFNQHIDMM